MIHEGIENELRTSPDSPSVSCTSEVLSIRRAQKLSSDHVQGQSVEVDACSKVQKHSEIRFRAVLGTGKRVVRIRVWDRVSASWKAHS